MGLHGDMHPRPTALTSCLIPTSYQDLHKNEVKIQHGQGENCKESSRYISLRWNKGQLTVQQKNIYINR